MLKCNFALVGLEWNNNYCFQRIAAHKALENFAKPKEKSIFQFVALFTQKQADFFHGNLRSRLEERIRVYQAATKTGIHVSFQRKKTDYRLIMSATAKERKNLSVWGLPLIK